MLIPSSRIETGIVPDFQGNFISDEFAAQDPTRPKFSQEDVTVFHFSCPPNIPIKIVTVIITAINRIARTYLFLRTFT